MPGDPPVFEAGEWGTIEVVGVNGEPGLVIGDAGGLAAALSIATDGERILGVFAVIIPDPLA